MEVARRKKNGKVRLLPKGRGCGGRPGPGSCRGLDALRWILGLTLIKA